MVVMNFDVLWSDGRSIASSAAPGALDEGEFKSIEGGRGRYI